MTTNACHTWLSAALEGAAPFRPAESAPQKPFQRGRISAESLLAAGADAVGNRVWVAAFCATSVRADPAVVEAVDWSAATPVEIRITREGFEPHQVELRRNQPAILRVANADDRPRVFNAPSFFRPTDSGALPDALDIPPKSTLDIRVVPLRSGRFPFGGPDIPVKSWGSGIAVMYVEGILIVK